MASGRTTFKAKISRTSKLYYSVNLFKTLAEMRDFAAKTAGGGVGYYSKVHGICIYEEGKPKNGKTSDRLGWIALCEGVGLEIISHECVHAAMGALHRKNVLALDTGDIGADDAEQLCYIAGYLTHQIARKLYKMH